MKKITGPIAAILIFGLVIAFLPVSAGIAASLDVCLSGCPYSSIQAAINAATPGDTIIVAAGTYTEQILIQKELTLIGAGIGNTVVKAPNTRVTAPGYTVQVWSGDNWTTDYLLAASPTDGTPISVKMTGFTFDANGTSHVDDRYIGLLGNEPVPHQFQYCEKLPIYPHA